MLSSEGIGEKICMMNTEFPSCAVAMAGRGIEIPFPTEWPG